MLRSGRLPALDEDAVQLAAAGLVRLGLQQCGHAQAEAAAWRTRATSFAHTWLAFGHPPAPNLQVPAGPVLHTLVHTAAHLLLQAHDGHSPAVLEWLGLRSSQAHEQGRRTNTAHPPEPTALALVWHAVQAATAQEDHDHLRRIADRHQAYTRQHHHRQDTLALILACTRLAATTLTELNHHDPNRAAEQLDVHATQHMPLNAPAPPWVPPHPQPPTN